MRYLDQFEIHLRSYEKAFPLPNLAKTTQHIESTQKHIEEILKNVELGEPNPELVRITIKKFIEWSSKRTTKKFTWLEVALLCHGLLFEIPTKGRLMQSEATVKILLGRFFKLHSDFFMSAYCWQGLLNAYLNVSPRREEVYKPSWLELRAFLQTTLDDVARQSSFKPRWLDALLEYRIILTENATQILAEEALQGRMDRIDQIAREMNIPSTSWFWPDLLMSQIEAITAYPDEQFKAAINQILLQLKKHKECLNDGLEWLLNRYSKCASLEPHEELKSTAVYYWHSPSLEERSNWERVPEAKQMVQRWLVMEDLKDFFLTLRQTSDDDSLDRRRFEFWMQYLDQISFSFLILGPETRESFKALLANKVGRYSALTGTNRANNAFLIRIGKNYIVEFGGVGKTWAYSEAKIRHLLEYGSIGYNELRAPYQSLFKGYAEANEGGLAHLGVWETKFHRALQYLGISPDTMSLDDFLKRYKIRKEKLPSGTIMIRHFYYDGTIANFLRSQGFSFKSTAEGFYLNPHGMANYKPYVFQKKDN